MKGLYVSSCNILGGGESCWDVDDPSFAWRRAQDLISPYDKQRIEHHADHMIVEAGFTGATQTMNALHFLEERLKEVTKDREYRGRKWKESTSEIAELKKQLEKTSEERDSEILKWKERYATECSTGARFLAFDAGKAYKKEVEAAAAAKAVEQFKRSEAFYAAAMEEAMKCYDGIVKKCQERLRQSGLASDEVIRVLDPPMGMILTRELVATMMK